MLDPAKLVFAEAAQLVLDKAAVAEELPKNEREDRVAAVVENAGPFSLLSLSAQYVAKMKRTFIVRLP
jgi:hypothetical protein